MSSGIELHLRGMMHLVYEFCQFWCIARPLCMSERSFQMNSWRVDLRCLRWGLEGLSQSRGSCSLPVLAEWTGVYIDEVRNDSYSKSCSGSRSVGSGFYMNSPELICAYASSSFPDQGSLHWSGFNNSGIRIGADQFGGIHIKPRTHRSRTTTWFTVAVIPNLIYVKTIPFS